MSASIPELPPFTPRLEGFRLDEFQQHCLSLLAFSVEHDQAALDLAPFQIEPPPPPPEPQIPLLPHVWYPKPTREVRDWALGLLMPPRANELLGKTRNHEAQQAMRPLLAGNGAIQILGEAGIGKTTFLAHIANHERTRQRYRRIWWFDDPSQVPQLLALALDNSQALSNPDDRFELLSQALADDILLVIDNVSIEEALQFQILTPHLILGVETEPQILEDDEEIPTDPENIVTLRRLERADAVELMIHGCDLTHHRNTLRGQMRAWMSHLAQLLDGHPLAIQIVSALFREDNLPMEYIVEIFSERIEPESPNPHLALDISLHALPDEYIDLLSVFAVLPSTGASFEALKAATRTENDLVLYRGLSFLTKHGFISPLATTGTQYVAHDLVLAWVKRNYKPPQKLTDEFQRWILRIARRNREKSVEIFKLQREILHSLNTSNAQSEFHRNLVITLGAYLREYAPSYLPEDAPIPKLIGERAKAMSDIDKALQFTVDGNIDKAIEAFTEGLKLAEKHGSDHEIAEGLVAFAYFYDSLKKDYHTATKLLERAAKLVYDLKAEDSVHLVRLGLSMLYRKQERYKDALGVLDDAPDTYAERVRIYRAMQQWDSMLKALEATGDLSPYARAEGYLQAERYAEALEALIDAKDIDSGFLRAVIYHLQDDLPNAIRGYEMVLENVNRQDYRRTEILLAMGKAHVAQGDLDQGQKLFLQALDNHPTVIKPDSRLKGRILSQLAALHLRDSDYAQAIKLAENALEALDKSPNGHAVYAEIYRTIGRSYWKAKARSRKTKQYNQEQALIAFEQEVDHAQAVAPRDENRIGLALHHLADAYRINGQIDRSVANYRRALTHIDTHENSDSRFMTQVALHHALYEAQRYGQSLEILQTIITQLSAKPPAGFAIFGLFVESPSSD